METRHLLLAKYLLQKAKEVFSKEDSMSCGLAVSLCQDSVEMLVRAVARELDADYKKEFHLLVDGIKNAKKNPEGKELPLKAKMLHLNQARVGFKHYGNLPDAQDAAKYLEDTEACLRQAIPLFFNIDYDSISLADLIINSVVRNKLKSAEQYCHKDEFKECIRECAEAEKLVSHPLHQIIPRAESNMHRVSIPDSLGSHAERDYVERTASNVLKYIHDYLNGLRDLTMAALLDIKPEHLLRFKHLAPHEMEPWWFTTVRRSIPATRPNSA